MRNALVVAAALLVACGGGQPSKPVASETVRTPDVAPAPSTWAKEPTAYRGVPWKASVSDARGKITPAPAFCFCSEAEDLKSDNCPFAAATDPTKAPLLRTCSTSFEVGGVEVSELLLFERDLLHGSLWTFDAGEFDKMRDIFVERYGPPTSSANEEITNRMGAKFTQTRAKWLGNTVSVELVRYGSDLTKSGATVWLNEYAKRREAASDAKKKKGAEAF